MLSLLNHLYIFSILLLLRDFDRNNQENYVFRGSNSHLNSACLTFGVIGGESFEGLSCNYSSGLVSYQYDSGLEGL